MTKINQEGLDLIKSFEGLRLDAYKDIVDVWTIGYGHTAMAGPPAPVSGMRITRQEAEDLLRKDLKQYEDAVSRAINKPMTDNQFAAMVSLCYNIGIGGFSGSSITRKFNAGDVDGAAASFLLWVKAGGKKVKGLERRREAEMALFKKRGSKPIPPPPKPEPKPEPTPAPKPSVINVKSIGAFIAALMIAAAAWLMKSN